VTLKDLEQRIANLERQSRQLSPAQTIGEPPIFFVLTSTNPPGGDYPDPADTTYPQHRRERAFPGFLVQPIITNATADGSGGNVGYSWTPYSDPANDDAWPAWVRVVAPAYIPPGIPVPCYKMKPGVYVARGLPPMIVPWEYGSGFHCDAYNMMGTDIYAGGSNLNAASFSIGFDDAFNTGNDYEVGATATQGISVSAGILPSASGTGIYDIGAIRLSPEDHAANPLEPTVGSYDSFPVDGTDASIVKISNSEFHGFAQPYGYFRFDFGALCTSASRKISIQLEVKPVGTTGTSAWVALASARYVYGSAYLEYMPSFTVFKINTLLPASDPFPDNIRYYQAQSYASASVATSCVARILHGDRIRLKINVTGVPGDADYLLTKYLTEWDPWAIGNGFFSVKYLPGVAKYDHWESVV
jgi:hypothetical protein